MPQGIGGGLTQGNLTISEILDQFLFPCASLEHQIPTPGVHVLYVKEDHVRADK